METIEERMQIRFHMNGEPHAEHRYYETYKECVAAATEQDSIARADERERCIKVAQDTFCWMKCNKTNDRDVCYAKKKEHCFWHNKLRKAMEGRR